jgi:hypothetical protein
MRGWAAAVAGALIAAMPAAAPALAASAGRAGGEEHPVATCFWEGPISTERKTTRGFDGRYFNFPEESATYWLSRFRLPAGSRLVLRGRYPRARYMSLNAYADAAPTDSLSDVAVRPDPGSENPFREGARRDGRKRSWHVTVVDAPVPAGSRSRNTLYARAGNAAIEVAYRVYEPDRGLDLTGATGLPRIALVLADGTRLRERRACAAINDANRSITVDSTPEEQWEVARRTPPCDPQTNPAYDPPRWERFFTYEFGALAVLTDCTAAGRALRRSATPEVRGGNYSNRDSAYVYSHLSRRFGSVLVVRAKLPRTPETRDGERIMGGGDMRFWSLCTGESRVTTFTPDCLADRQVPLGKGRRFTIAVSRRADRPDNARRDCGFGWLDWGDRGDGVGDRDYGLLIMRNMLVSPTFEHAIQRVTEAGDEADVMGPYLPRSTYTTTAGFEARGC